MMTCRDASVHACNPRTEIMRAYEWIKLPGMISPGRLHAAMSTSTSAKGVADWLFDALRQKGTINTPIRRRSKARFGCCSISRHPDDQLREDAPGGRRHHGAHRLDAVSVHPSADRLPGIDGQLNGKGTHAKDTRFLVRRQCRGGDEFFVSFRIRRSDAIRERGPDQKGTVKGTFQPRWTTDFMRSMAARNLLYPAIRELRKQQEVDDLGRS